MSIVAWCYLNKKQRKTFYEYLACSIFIDLLLRTHQKTFKIISNFDKKWKFYLFFFHQISRGKNDYVERLPPQSSLSLYSEIFPSRKLKTFTIPIITLALATKSSALGLSWRHGHKWMCAKPTKSVPNCNRRLETREAFKIVSNTVILQGVSLITYKYFKGWDYIKF